jgi:hypothetical protein
LDENINVRRSIKVQKNLEKFFIFEDYFFDALSNNKYSIEHNILKSLYEYRQIYKKNDFTNNFILNNKKQLLNYNDSLYLTSRKLDFNEFDFKFKILNNKEKNDSYYYNSSVIYKKFNNLNNYSFEILEEQRIINPYVEFMRDVFKLKKLSDIYDYRATNEDLYYFKNYSFIFDENSKFKNEIFILHLNFLKNLKNKININKIDFLLKNQIKTKIFIDDTEYIKILKSYSNCKHFDSSILFFQELKNKSNFIALYKNFFNLSVFEKIQISKYFEKKYKTSIFNLDTSILLNYNLKFYNTFTQPIIDYINNSNEKNIIGDKKVVTSTFFETHLMTDFDYNYDCNQFYFYNENLLITNYYVCYILLLVYLLFLILILVFFFF